ncbi:hypothetical protein MKZ08_03765 [Viridibacillus sp. FSL R5-0477]|uniref:Uncharacterized protein n=1 Tax=Viridibacillus arenosi FSL R5-213 TaxID=1227360 RepID=W4EPU3_9BACL|nr:hypothetical protein [Viridibacillus arenosi]ETT81997.1 hypothetical protein C176_17536 [Viridibacillus arenosi FSL R5-213]OMC90472.1 hypothetical protein BK137_12885 [Viridibacillus arenosi]
MKKTYFMRIYNLIQFLALLLSLSIVFSILLKILYGMWLKIDKNIPFVSQILYGIELASRTVEIVNILLPTLLVVLIFQEIIKRIFNDSLINLGKSFVGTLQFRRFLKQHQKIPMSDTDRQSQSENLSISRFNRSVNKCVLDLTYKELNLFIKVPREAQSQKILKEYEEQIKEHISSLYPEYIISTFERNKLSLWLIGTKRK